MYTKPRPAMSPDALLAAIAADPAQDALHALAVELDAAQRALSDRRTDGDDPASRQRERALDLVFSSARAVLAQARK